MPCKHEKYEDEYNEDFGYWQHCKFCTKNNKKCNGTDGVCSLYEEVKEPQVEKKPEPAEKPKVEEKEEDDKVKG